MDSKTMVYLARLIVLGMAVQLAVIVFVFYRDYQGRVNLVAAQQRGCERYKQDRKDNADFQIAHAKYITRVTSAQSVKEDVKSAAREALNTFDRTSSALLRRSKVLCSDVYPKASLIP